MNSDKIIQSLLGLLILILSGLFSWTLVGIGSLNKEVLIMRTERAEEHGELDEARRELKTQIALMQQTLGQIAANTEDDARQDEQLRKFWRIVGTHRDWINAQRALDGLPLVSWPPLD